MPYTVQNLKKLKFYPDWKDWREIVILIEAMTGEQLGPEFRPIIRSRAFDVVADGDVVLRAPRNAAVHFDSCGC